MRELKFRAWDDGELLEDVTPVANGDNNAFPNLAIVVFEANGETDGIRQVDVIEQYTGLKDKNGKEIYEGDIVEEDIDFNSKMTDGTFRYRVYWDECLLCWVLDPIGKESIHDELWQTNLSRRVIGNIHENPDLLGDTNVTNKEEDDGKTVS